MPVETEYLDNGLGTLFRGTGIVTGEDILSANQRIFSTPEKIRKYKYGLADWTGVTEYRVKPSELEYAAFQDKTAANILPELFVAVVADKPLDYGLSRMWSLFIEVNDLNWEVAIFNNRTEAERWLKDQVKAKYQIDLTFR